MYSKHHSNGRSGAFDRDSKLVVCDARRLPFCQYRAAVINKYCQERQTPIDQCLDGRSNGVDSSKPAAFSTNRRKKHRMFGAWIFALFPILHENISPSPLPKIWRQPCRHHQLRRVPIRRFCKACISNAIATPIRFVLGYAARRERPRWRTA